ncbi:MAG: hypothetical protein KY433_05865 [Actinobacteria bacterium]|nr:hypothetical protein [Actinomycetota bacterium]
MESSAAGYVDVAPLLEDNLRRLAALRPGVPVLSLYLDLNPTDFGTQPARQSAYTSLLDEAHKRIEEHQAGHDARMSLRADLERATSFLADYQPKRGRGLAIFCASRAGLFEAYTLPRAPSTQIVIDDSPYMTPLFVAADVRDWLIVVIDAHNARLLHGNPDHVEELQQVREPVSGQHEGQGTSAHQRAVEHQIDEHLKRTAADVERLLATGRFEKVLVGAPAEIAPRFEEALGTPARERIAGRFDVEVPDAAPDEIRTAAAACFDEDERRHERELLDRLAAGLGRGERAVAGRADVLAMLEQARVETLLYDERFGSPEPKLLEQALEHAVAQSAEVLPLRHHPDALAEHGHIAAVLRF